MEQMGTFYRHIFRVLLLLENFYHSKVILEDICVPLFAGHAGGGGG